MAKAATFCQAESRHWVNTKQQELAVTAKGRRGVETPFPKLFTVSMAPLLTWTAVGLYLLKPAGLYAGSLG